MAKIRNLSPKREEENDDHDPIEVAPARGKGTGSVAVRLRPRVWLSLLFLLGLGVVANFLWQYGAPIVARQPQYRITADAIHISPAPPWIRTDIKSQVIGDADFGTNASVLDNWPDLAARVKHAFERHPWVESVELITRRVPAALEVQLKYRQPIAAVESHDDGNIAFLPIDRFAVRLPDADLSEAERRRLPRISGIDGRPPLGQTWSDPRVTGGVKLIAALTDVWQKLTLVEVLAAPNQPAAVGTYTFELVTKGGTRIVWGAEPGQETSSAEKSFEIKRQQLLEYAAQHGHLELIDGPESIDVRRDLLITPRAARAKTGSRTK